MAEFQDEEPSDNEISNSKKKSTLRPGIIYLSRIPPYMKPLKVRHVFSDFGEIGRVFLQPEGMAVVEPLSIHTHASTHHFDYIISLVG